DRQVELQRIGSLREDVAPTRVAAFQEAGVNRGSRVANEDVVLPNGELHFAAVFREGPFDELHRAGGNDRHVAKGSCLAYHLGRSLHFREATAVCSHGSEDVVLPLQFYAAQGIAATFVVGREDRAADQLAEQSR